MTGMNNGKNTGHVKDVTGNHSSEKGADVTNMTEK